MHKNNEVFVQLTKYATHEWMQTHTYHRFLPGLDPFLVFSTNFNVENSNWYIGLYVFVMFMKYFC